MNLDFLDDIRAALDSPHTANVHLLADVATEYSESVVIANRRMREVTRLLDQGLRGEAMQLAGQRPLVLDTVATLDFPELLEWRTLLGSLGMEMPPSLRMDYAERIDNAYAEIRPLEDLLTRHRALALGKAPLNNRIFILRKLLNRDPTNPGWREDLANLETARLKEINPALKKAVARKDYKTIRSIDEELESDWSVPIPVSLVHDVSTHRQTFEENADRKKLAEIAPALNDAFVARDLDAGQAARDQWKQISETVQLDESDALVMETVDALAWLQDEDFAAVHSSQFQQTLGQLEKGLDTNVPLSKLDQLVYSVNQFKREWPPEIQQRTEAYRSRLKRRKSLNMFLSIAGVVGLLALIGGSLWYFVQQNRRAADINAAITSIDEMVLANDFSEANKFFNELPTELKDDSRLASAKSDIDSGLKNLSQASQVFQSAMSGVRESGVDSPNFEELDRAIESAITDEQKEDAAAFADEVNRRQLANLKQRDNAFTKELDQLANQLTDLSKTDGTNDSVDEPAVVATVGRLLENLSQLESDNTGTLHRQPLVSPELLQRCNELKVRVEQVRANAEQMRSVKESLSQLVGGLESPEEYLKRLKAFRSTLSEEHFLATQIERAIRELQDDNTWTGFLEVSSFIGSTNWSKAIASSEQASNVASTIEQLMETHPNIWLTELLSDRLPHLDSIQARQSPDGKTIKGRLIDRHLGGFWKKASVLKLEDGQAFYLTESPSSTSTRTIRLSYIESHFLDEQQKEFLTPNATNGSTISDAPHSQLCKDIQLELETLETKGWSSTFISIIKRVLKTDDNEMDPLIRNYFLYRVLDACIAGDHSYAALSEVRDSAKEVHRRGGDWVKAARRENEGAEKQLYEDACSDANKIFHELKTLQHWPVAASRKRDECISIATRDDLDWLAVGLLVQNELDSWSVPGLDAGESNGPVQQLYCLFQKPNDSHARFHAVATLSKGRIKFVAPDQLVSGRVVFVRNKKSN